MSTNTKNTFLIPVSWSVYSTIRVEADNLQEALLLAKEHIDDLPITSDCEYIDGSYAINEENLEEAQSYSDISSYVLHKDGKITS